VTRAEGAVPAADRIILVDRDDVQVGVEDKLRAHEEALLHRAFSVFIIRPDGALLLQRRAHAKYHSGGLWSNTCCSHPRPGESTVAAAHRRLVEEMGFDCRLATAFSFVYRADLGGGMFEHEYDHVFVGAWDGVPAPDPTEVDAWRWASIADIRAEIARRPGAFTAWFRIALDELVVRGGPGI
jgi:isopentenyl-diphosphate delta-isomerase